MSGRFMETEKEEQKKLIDNKAAVEYEYGGYQIRVHFSGLKAMTIQD